MELTAASKVVSLSKKIIDELNLRIDKIYFWTDSMSVLRYIANKNARYHTFVANRLAIIHESTTDNQWKYIDGKQNPADLASRGVQAFQLQQNSHWFQGPEFLWKDEEEWPKNSTETTLPSNDVEVKKLVNTISVSEQKGFDRVLSHFSNWDKLKRITAWLLKYIDFLKAKVKARKCDTLVGKTLKECTKCPLLTVDIIRRAEDAIIRHVQKHFTSEYEILMGKKLDKVNVNLGKSSKLYKLDPFIHSDSNLMRVGGRLKNSVLTFEAKHQILPRTQLCLESSLMIYIVELDI